MAYWNPFPHDHPIFRDIYPGNNLEAVKQRVTTDAAVLEERERLYRRTPLMVAICYNKPAIAVWLIEHGGQLDLEAAGDDGRMALHHASKGGPLAVVQALVAAGANPAALAGGGSTPLICASINGHTDIVAWLLQLPPVKARIDAINQYTATALSRASRDGDQPIMQGLLDAGADPTVPAGPHSPLRQALSNNRHTVAALLRLAIAEPERARALHKARSLVGAGAAALACLQGRVGQGEALPQLERITPERHQQQRRRTRRQQQEELQATVAFAVGESGGLTVNGMCEDLYLKLLGYLLHGWADKGPEA